MTSSAKWSAAVPLLHTTICFGSYPIHSANLISSCSCGLILPPLPTAVLCPRVPRGHYAPPSRHSLLAPSRHDHPREGLPDRQPLPVLFLHVDLVRCRK